jgi:protein-tyrosine phosphatase
MAHAVLFVCTANICRSPTAAAVLRRELRRAGAESRFEVASAGTHDYHLGKPPCPAAVEVAKARGIDIVEHVARRVTPGDFERYDFILAMDRANVAALRSMAPTRSKRKIELLLEYGDRYHGLEVPDPYGGAVQDFERALDMIDDGCRGLVKLLVR